MRLDIGLVKTQVVESAITEIDANGMIRYRGYTINDIYNSDMCYESVAYLLYNGNLPINGEDSKIDTNTIPPSIIHGISTLAKALPKNISPVSKMICLLSSLGHDYLPTVSSYSEVRSFIATYIYICSIIIGGDFCDAKSSSVIDNFYSNLSFNSSEDFKKEKSAILEKSLILIADNELNASTFTARVCASCESDILLCIIAALCSWSGPLHGAANQRFCEMLLSFENTSEIEIEKSLHEKLQRREKISGFGHRVFRLDPRVQMYKSLSAKATEYGKLWVHKKAELIEKIVIQQKDICSNCDLYASTLYYNLGFLPKYHPLIFSMGRLLGWLSHIREQHNNNKLIRPRALTTIQNHRTL